MLLTKYFSGDKVKKDEVGGACGVFGGKGSACRILVGKPKEQRTACKT